MHILFALILISHAAYGEAIVTRIGIYERMSNCEAQRTALMPAIESVHGNASLVFCIPTNG